MRGPGSCIEPLITDETLARAAAGGDKEAFRALYLRHHRAVHTLVTKLLGGGPDREDVIQDVFLQLHRALPSFRGDSTLSTFLHRIATHVALDHLRRRLRQQCIDYDSDALESAADGGQDPEQRSSARQQLSSLLHHLDEIAQDKRCALMLVAVAGLSLSDAAAQVGANSGSIKQRVVRARRELTALAARGCAPRRSRRPRRTDARDGRALGRT
jgi:RNA polymerase sigma-70 factor (ECF subfamily)